MSTQYDDVFRTLANDCPDLLVPLINEVFGENYPEEAEIRFYPNEHFINQKDGKTQERITDTCFELSADTTKKYHLECQSTPDSSMLIRMFEYDTQIALDDCIVKENVLTVDFPNSAILYLRCTKNTPDKIHVTIRTPSGQLSYEIAVVKIQNYPLEKIFQKKLLFLIPFYIFTHENNFKIYNENEAQMHLILTEYQLIRNKLEEFALSGVINEYIKCTLMEMCGKVIEYLAKDYTHVQEGVKSIMVGKVLDYEAKDILNKGVSQGFSRGIEKGKLDICLELLHDGLLSYSEAAKRLQISENELREMMK